MRQYCRWSASNKRAQGPASAQMPTHDDAVTEEIEVPAWRLHGARPQYDASLLWLDSSCLICFVN